MAEQKDVKDNYQELQESDPMHNVDTTITGESDPEKLYQTLIEHVKMYHPSDDLSGIEKAYRLAFEMHKDQKRKSGEPYIIHPLCVAIILADLRLDKETIIGGLLHDVVEDTPTTLEEITEQFGPDVALLVDGVTKLTQLSWSADKVEIQAENLRKMFLAMAKDIRVILIKLADRLHNMRTMQYQSPAKQIEKSRETMEIYSPIANRLGISKLKVELDDLSLKYLHPDVYENLKNSLALTETAREEFVDTIVKEVSENLERVDIKATVGGRVKHLFSIYKKMVTQNKTLDDIYDVFAVRVIVDSIKDCYGALCIIHELYKPIPGRFKDYIAMPKPNMYQSLHTTLMSSTGQPFEIQIRTWEMHRIAELGIAAHWKYKELPKGAVSKNTDGEIEKMSWLRQILEWQQEMSDNKEFVSSVKSDLNLFSDSVYCFTPTGDVKNLPAGSNPIDFAYAIHSAVGDHMVGARVNGKHVPIDYVLQNGDRVEIITSQNSRGPSTDWIKMVKSTQAKNKISQFFKALNKKENIEHGKDLLDKLIKTKGLSREELLKNDAMDAVIAKYGFRDWDSVMAAVGHGGLKEGQILSKLQEVAQKKHAEEITDEDILESAEAKESDEKAARRSHTQNGIIVKGAHDVAVRFSRCCSPVPGDDIVGFVTRGRGISIHRADCINIINLPEEEKNRLIEASWQDESGEAEGHYYADILIYGYNRVGMVVDISKVLSERKIDISTMTSRVSKQGMATITLAFEVAGKAELDELIHSLKNISGVVDIQRTNT